jgi:hypothetical protein
MIISSISCKHDVKKQPHATSLDTVNPKPNSNSNSIDSSSVLVISNPMPIDTLDIIQKYENCDKFYKSEEEAHSLETIKDTYLKNILGYYYTLDDSITNQNIAKYVEEFHPSIDINSEFKIEINRGFAKGYEVYITGKSFDANNHKINESERFTCLLIDNHIFWGTDEGLPQEEIDRFEVRYNGKSILIPENDFRNLYNPLRFGGKLFHGVLLADNKEHYVIFILFGSDGAGSYNASFIFKDGKYLQLVVERMC